MRITATSFVVFSCALACDAPASRDVEEPSSAPAEASSSPDVAQTDLDPPAPPAPPAPPPAPEESEIVIGAIGDNTLGDPAGSERAPGSFHRALADAGGDLGHFFSGVREVLASDDLTIGNLEGTLTTTGCREDVAFAFRGKPEFAKMLALGSVEVVNLANNHSFDCGSRGFRDTRIALASENVGYFGLGDVDRRVVKGIEVVNLGYLGGKTDFKVEMEKAVRKNKRDDNLVIVSFHWGIEGMHAATAEQRILGRAAIDAGADLVLGHHPHVLQGIEDRAGKKIVYSLGNFVFGGNGQPENLDSMIFQARFKKKDGKVVPVGYEIIPVAISGNPTQNDFRPVLLSGDEADRVKRAVETYSATMVSSLTGR